MNLISKRSTCRSLGSYSPSIISRKYSFERHRQRRQFNHRIVLASVPLPKWGNTVAKDNQLQRIC